MFGFSADEVVGKPYPRRASTVMEGEQQHCWPRHGRRNPDRSQLSRTHKDGALATCAALRRRVLRRLGCDRRCAYVLEDVTEKLSTQEMLRQSQKMEAVGQLTGGVRPRLQQSWMVILANVEECWSRTTCCPKQREQLENIRLGSARRRADQASARVLAQAASDAAIDRPHRSGGQHDKLCAARWASRSRSEAILADDLWTTSVDRAQLEAALVNLCVNARDACDGGRS